MFFYFNKGNLSNYRPRSKQTKDSIQIIFVSISYKLIYNNDHFIFLIVKFYKSEILIYQIQFFLIIL